MKNITKLSLVALAFTVGLSSCIDEVVPQESNVTAQQAAEAPNSFENFVTSVTSSLTGQMLYDQYSYGYVNSSTSHYPWDFGYASTFLFNDVMGQDVVIPSTSCWYEGVYICSSDYVVSQQGWSNWLQWYFGYTFINNCNTVLGLAASRDQDDSTTKQGKGIALAVRSMVYLQMAQYYSQKPYLKDSTALTVPIVTESTTSTTSNPRATWAEMLSQVIGDLKTAKDCLKDYKRADKTTPDAQVCAGLLARAYLLKGDWKNARSSAEEAMKGYSELSAEELTDQNNGFNNPNNSSWMFCGTYKSSDHCLMYNDGDTSWGSQMVIEVGPSGCGYAANYDGAYQIDRHLFETIPATDARKDQWIDFSVDDCETEAAVDEFIAPRYTSAAENIEWRNWNRYSPAGASVKFRPANGVHNDQYAGFCVSVPYMRYEEMKLIQIEAAGRNGDSDAQTLLEAFAKTRDPQYTYGMHSIDNNYGGNLSEFLKEVHWQRRVELWGEGFATFDMKRLGTDLIRSYAGTNHVDGYQWNTSGTPYWFCGRIPSNETNYNDAIVDNPAFSVPTNQNSEQHKW